jgi:phosphatidylinositol alpha-1,6-mannosyltransferase
MRILLCLTSLDFNQGGIAAVNRNVLRALQGLRSNGAGVAVHALVYHGQKPELPAAYWCGLASFCAEGCRSSRLRFVARYVALALRWRPALVFVDHLHLAVVPYRCQWLASLRYVLFCHGIEFSYRISLVRQKAFRGAVLRLSNSYFTARRLSKLFPGIDILPCELGMDDLAVPAAPKAEGAIADAFGKPQRLGARFVLIVSRLACAEAYKGHDQLIAVFPLIQREVPEAQLVVVGDGDDRERLMALARHSGAGSAMLFPGFAPPSLLAALYARCRVFAMPSRGEGFGLVYLEAMRFGKPCVASNVDGGSEVVVDGLTGLLVRPDSLPAIRDAVARLLADDDLAKRLGEAGRSRLDSHYRFHHFQARLLARLDKVLASGGSESRDRLAVLERE